MPEACLGVSRPRPTGRAGRLRAPGALAVLCRTRRCELGAGGGQNDRDAAAAVDAAWPTHCPSHSEPMLRAGAGSASLQKAFPSQEGTSGTAFLPTALRRPRHGGDFRFQERFRSLRHRTLLSRSKLAIATRMGIPCSRAPGGRRGEVGRQRHWP